MIIKNILKSVVVLESSLEKRRNTGLEIGIHITNITKIKLWEEALLYPMQEERNNTTQVWIVYHKGLLHYKQNRRQGRSWKYPGRSR